MRTMGMVSHHARWRPPLGAILEVGAAVRTLVARLITAGAGDIHGEPGSPATAVSDGSAPGP
jgi:hypothetical protein